MEPAVVFGSVVLHNKEENSINEHVEFPCVYLNLKNF